MKQIRRRKLETIHAMALESQTVVSIIESLALGIQQFSQVIVDPCASIIIGLAKHRDHLSKASPGGTRALKGGLWSSTTPTDSISTRWFVNMNSGLGLRFGKSLLVLAFSFILMSTHTVVSAQTPTAANVASVAQAQKSAYAIRDAINGCPTMTGDVLGWPASLVRECIYKEGGLTGYVLLLDVKPEIVANWIATACAQILPGSSKCFNRILACAQNTSGMMFAISGNMLENMNGEPWKNWFFRNGMTVRMPHQPNRTTDQVPLDRQKELALMADADILRIPTGITRFWRTMPAQFAARFPTESVPKSVKKPQDKQAWLTLTRDETLTALKKPNNRLLEAWMAAHRKTIAKGKCPADSAP
jgi:hypothetical protein